MIPSIICRPGTRFTLLEMIETHSDIFSIYTDYTWTQLPIKKLIAHGHSIEYIPIIAHLQSIEYIPIIAHGRSSVQWKLSPTASRLWNANYRPWPVECVMPIIAHGQSSV